MLDRRLGPAKVAGLRYTPTGKPVATLRLAITPRQYSGEQGRYIDGTTTYLDGQLWDTAAENVAESLRKGDRVLVVGRWVTRVYTPAQGPNAGIEQRRLEVVIDEIGPSLAFATATATATPTRNPRSNSKPAPTEQDDADQDEVEREAIG